MVYDKTFDAEIHLFYVYTIFKSNIIKFFLFYKGHSKQKQISIEKFCLVPKIYKKRNIFIHFIFAHFNIENINYKGFKKK